MEAINATLLDQLRTGDTNAFTVLFQTYWRFLYTVAYRRVQDEDLAQDIVQEVFIQVWDKREKLSIEPAYLEYYLLKAIKNRIINHYTSQRIKAGVLEQAMHLMTGMDDASYQPSRYLELDRILDEEMEKLPETMRKAFLMRNDHHSIRTIAERLNLAEQTVKNNLTEATHRLRGSLIKRLADDEPAGLLLIVMFLIDN